MENRIEKVAVLGAGTMGAQIAGHFSNAGIPSLLFDINSDLAKKIISDSCLKITPADSMLDAAVKVVNASKN